MIKTEEYVGLRDYYKANRNSLRRWYQHQGGIASEIGKDPVYKTYGHLVRAHMRLIHFRNPELQRFFTNMYKVFAVDWEKKNYEKYHRHYDGGKMVMLTPKEHRREHERKEYRFGIDPARGHSVTACAYAVKARNEESKLPDYSGFFGIFRRIRDYIFN